MSRHQLQFTRLRLISNNHRVVTSDHATEGPINTIQRAAVSGHPSMVVTWTPDVVQVPSQLIKGVGMMVLWPPEDFGIRCRE